MCFLVYFLTCLKFRSHKLSYRIPSPTGSWNPNNPTVRKDACDGFFGPFFSFGPQNGTIGAQTAFYSFEQSMWDAALLLCCAAKHVHAVVLFVTGVPACGACGVRAGGVPVTGGHRSKSWGPRVV